MISSRTCSLAVLYALFCSVPAYAGSGEHVLSVRPEYVNMSGHGGGLSVGYQWGIDDFVNLWVDTGWAATAVNSALEQRVMATFGAVYHLDSFEWVPYLATSLGFYGRASQDGAFHSALGFELGGGVDYRPARSWSVGMFGMFHAIAVGRIPHHATAGVRVNLYFR